MRVYSFCPVGYDGVLVAVEIEIRRGIPGIDIVGLPDTALRESRQRVRAAIRNSGFEVPKQRILLNLSPAGLRKSGARYDLALAVAILAASHQLPDRYGASVLALGELSLDGSVLPVPGSFGALRAARDAGIDSCVCSSGEDAAAFGGQGLAVHSLGFLGDLRGDDDCIRSGLDSLPAGAASTGSDEGRVAATLPLSASAFPDLSWLSPLQKLALGVSVAGGHHMLLLGAPGSGKSSMLKLAGQLCIPAAGRHVEDILRIRSLRPPATAECDCATGAIPVRRPHSSSSFEGMFGGGRALGPGEISLAHGGLLVLDEIFDFQPRILAALRAPMEQGEISVGRAGSTSRYPCEFTVWAAGNLCPCGGLGMEDGFCVCSPPALARYWARLGAALEDRFDIRLVFGSGQTLEVGRLPQWVRKQEYEFFDFLADCRETSICNGRLPGLELVVAASGSDGGFEPDGQDRGGTATKQALAPLVGPGWSRRGWTSVERLALTLARMDGRAEAGDGDRYLARLLRGSDDFVSGLGAMLGD